MSETTETPKKTKDAAPPKGDKAAAAGKAGDSKDAPKDPAKSYSRGENQKPVTERYRSNWDTIFGKRK